MTKGGVFPLPLFQQALAVDGARVQLYITYILSIIIYSVSPLQLHKIHALSVNMYSILPPQLHETHVLSVNMYNILPLQLYKTQMLSIIMFSTLPPQLHKKHLLSVNIYIILLLKLHKTHVLSIMFSILPPQLHKIHVLSDTICTLYCSLSLIQQRTINHYVQILPPQLYKTHLLSIIMLNQLNNGFRTLQSVSKIPTLFDFVKRIKCNKLGFLQGERWTGCGVVCAENPQWRGLWFPRRRRIDFRSMLAFECRHNFLY